MKRLEGAVELEELTRKNVGKALAFRSAPVAVVPGEEVEGEVAEEGAEADDTPPTTPPSPSTDFLNRAHHHYLRSLAELSLATSPVPDPLRQVQQITQRLNPVEWRGPPRPVQTVPLAGRRAKAGERTDGWALDEGEVSTPKVGGPIGRAKGSKGREGRRVQNAAGARAVEKTVRETVAEL